MRVIAGELGGRRLKSHDRSGLRPTSDRVRESMFSMLASRIDLDQVRVLDLFAGTGALGIEALSRGAASCRFVESDRRTTMIIEENLKTLGIAGRGRVTVRDAVKYVEETNETYDLILADPPYAATIFDALVHTLFRREILAEGGLFLLEHSSAMKPNAVAGAIVLVSRTFGDTGVTLMSRDLP